MGTLDFSGDLVDIIYTISFSGLKPEVVTPLDRFNIKDLTPVFTAELGHVR